MDLSEEGEFKKAEAMKLYHMVQQLSPQAGAILADRDFQYLMTVWQEGVMFNPLLFNIINPTGKELNA
jgi:hypothetical protein